MMLYYDVFETPLGWMGLLASSRGLRRTTLPQPSPDECVGLLGNEVEAAVPDPDRFEALKARLIRHFGGDPVSFAGEPIDVDDATPFFRAAWRACQSIPEGETRSYKWLATRAGSSRSARAAGQSMARNRLPIIVPCHRVISSDGGLGGFGQGANRLDLKRRLIGMESKQASMLTT